MARAEVVTLTFILLDEEREEPFTPQEVADAKHEVRAGTSSLCEGLGLDDIPVYTEEHR